MDLKATGGDVLRRPMDDIWNEECRIAFASYLSNHAFVKKFEQGSIVKVFISHLDRYAVVVDASWWWCIHGQRRSKLYFGMYRYSRF